MRVLLICHEQEQLNSIALARWLASFSDLTGVLLLDEPPQRKWRRIKREVKRVGWLRFADVLAFQLYYRAFLAKNDSAWEQRTLADLCRRFPDLSPSTGILRARSPNSAEARNFILQAAPDLIIARCKTLLKEEIFSIPSLGTFVMHPGICPEYRNAHGCFWALANDDLERVGMTLLKIDRGVDTGPVYGYFRYNYDEVRESHIVIQNRTVFDNLDALQDRLTAIGAGKAESIDTKNHKSGEWGQPWLSSYLRWKWRAQRRKTR